MDRFIKKTLKIYKALRVLERNKSQDSPYFSKSIERLIRYFAKKFPENCGLEENPSEYALSSISNMEISSGGFGFDVAQGGSTVSSLDQASGRAELLKQAASSGAGGQKTSS